MAKRIETDVLLLGRMTNLAISCLTEEEVVAVAARFLPRLFPGESGALFLRPAAGKEYEPAASWGGEWTWRPFPGDDCWSLRRRRLHSVRQGKEQPLCPHADHDPERWISLCIPMTAREDVLGVFHLLIPVEEGPARSGERTGAPPLPDDPSRPVPGSEAGETGALPDEGMDRRRLAALTADILAVIFVNLRLRRQIDDLSVRDALTGCFNRRYLEDSLARELKVVGRTGRPLAVVLMDIDHFGQFTEAFGHGASSLVLRELGEFLRKNVRDADLVCRYGADEFALLFPETDLTGARRRAEHLHAMLREVSLHGAGAHLRRITLSMGVAAHPDHGETWGDLMETAKASLKRAKQSGRNRVDSGD
ncbi:MAG: sensor domain-containing diguanylate cyclase [Pseudomonadota bacterium]|nr:sensor domain-containing diguanylate cyclase [Pseudomonadota bacterium]